MLLVVWAAVSAAAILLPPFGVGNVAIIISASYLVTPFCRSSFMVGGVVGTDEELALLLLLLEIFKILLSTSTFEVEFVRLFIRFIRLSVSRRRYPVPDDDASASSLFDFANAPVLRLSHVSHSQ